MNGLQIIAAAVTDTPEISTWSWATVTAISPLRVKLDGESTALAVTPDALVSALAVNDRVWVQLVTDADPARTARRLVALGKAGGMEDLFSSRLSGLELAAEDIQNTSGTTTSTTYTSTLSGVGATACGVTFVAPYSGKVVVHNGCKLSNSSSSNFAALAFHVRTGASIGSGSDVLLAADSFAFSHTGVSAMRGGAPAKLVSGLTPGNSYNVVQEFRVDGGTGTFVDKYLLVAGK
jgi:hypothetical protein